MKSPFSFRTALGSYAGLAAAAGWLLSGEARWVVWIFLGGLAVKTWIAWKRQRIEEEEEDEEE